MYLTNARTIIISNKIRWKIDNTGKSESSINGGGGGGKRIAKGEKVLKPLQTYHGVTCTNKFKEFDHDRIRFRIRFHIPREEKSIGDLGARHQDHRGGRGEGSSRDRLRWKPIEAVRIVTNAGAARNFQRDRLSRQQWRAIIARFPRKDTQSRRRSAAVLARRSNRFKGINPSS